MADKKITELNSVNLPLSGIEQIPIVQNGETKKVSADQLGGGGGSLWEVSTGVNSLIPKDSNNIASGDNAIAEGFGTEAKANYSRTGGRSTTVETSAEGGVAEGEDTITRGKGGYTNGIETEANGDASFAVGDNTIAQSYGEVVVGTYNALDASFNPTSATPTDKAFSVGVGSFQNRKDGFVVRKNGVVDAPEQSISEFNADTSGKIIVTKEILQNEQQKRIVQLNLPQVKILGFGSNFSITSPNSSFPTFTFDSGDTDENLLPLNTPKVFVAPFNCVATNLFIRTSIPNNYNYVFYKVDSNQANRVIIFNQTIQNGVNNINNPSSTQINKGDLILIGIKANNTDTRYADIFLTLEEI